MSIDLASKFNVKGDQCQTLRRLGRLHQTKGGNPNNQLQALVRRHPTDRNHRRSEPASEKDYSP